MEKPYLLFAFAVPLAIAIAVSSVSSETLYYFKGTEGINGYGFALVNGEIVQYSLYPENYTKFVGFGGWTLKLMESGMYWQSPSVELGSETLLNITCDQWFLYADNESKTLYLYAVNATSLNNVESALDPSQMLNYFSKQIGSAAWGSISLLLPAVTYIRTKKPEAAGIVMGLAFAIPGLIPSPLNAAGLVILGTSAGYVIYKILRDRV